MDDFSLEFSALVADVAEILNVTHLNKLKLVCCGITTPENSLMFGERESAAIQACISFFDMFYQLRHHWRWDNHRLLFTLIKRSNSQKALEKLEQFERKIDYTKKLRDLSSSFQSAHRSLPPGYAKMVAIIEKDYSDFSLEDCKELDEYLTSSFGSALHPPTYEKSSSIKITWYIPAGAVGGLLSKAYQAKEVVQLLSVSFFEVDEVVVWNKKWPYLPQVCVIK